MTNRSSVSFSTGTRTLWAIRAAKQPDAHSLFMQQNIVALEDQGLGDLAKLKDDREAFYAAYRRLQPKSHQTSITGIAGKFFRFAHEMTQGDLVLYPATKEKRVYVATVVGLYKYDTSASTECPHQRAVEWLGSFASSSLSPGARLELGAARMLFRLKSHGAEILRLASPLLVNKGSAPRSPEIERV